MSRSMSIVAVVLLSAGVAHGQPCPDGGWCENPANGHWYRLTQAGTWQEAEDEAVEAGGHLVTTNDQEEQDWIKDWFPRPGAPLWIGLYQDCDDPACTGCCTDCKALCCTGCNEDVCTDQDCEPAECWKWISGETINYEHWRDCAPDNGQIPENPHEDCGEMYHSSQATDTWTDRPCSVSQPGLIELGGREDPKIPTVSAWGFIAMAAVLALGLGVVFRRTQRQAA